ncbi:MAG: ferric reductase-like transmembrane domain-containing protein [Hyphomicrobiaceae bacterium]|nr:ferric reductase-like transmembrane domain-containing protein [Hyphomicrobiaceae bacterium]
MSRISKTPAIYLAASAGIILSIVLSVHGLTLHDITNGVRMTACVAFLCFLMVYLARPVRELTGYKELMASRRTLGLCVAIALSVHFGFVIAFFAVSSESVFENMPRLIGNSLGVVVIYAMAATSSNTAMQLLGRWWKRLHRVGMHYLWFLFLVSYAVALQNQLSLTTHKAAMSAVFIVVLVSGAGLRFFLWARRKISFARNGAQA